MKSIIINQPRKLIKSCLILFYIFISHSFVYAQNKESFVNRDGNVLMKAGSKENQSLFLFDTGCSLLVVSDQYCNAIGCKKTIRRVWTRDYMGKIKWYPVVLIPDFYIGDLHFKNVKAILKKDLEREFSRFACEEIPVEGLLGTNLLKQYNWELNFTDTTYRAVKTPIHYENGESLKFRLWKGMPYISLSINGNTINNILFDTGDVNAIVLPPKVFGQLFTENVYTNKLLAAWFNDAKKREYTTQGYSGDVEIFSNNYPMIIGAFSGLNRKYLGNGFLANSVVAINYSEKTVVIDKGKPIAPPKYVGIRFIFEEQVIRINAIYTVVEEKYPELQLGAVVQTVNGKNSQDIANMNPCERLTFLRALSRTDLEIVMETGVTYNLPAIY